MFEVLLWLLINIACLSQPQITHTIRPKTRNGKHISIGLAFEPPPPNCAIVPFVFLIEFGPKQFDVVLFSSHTRQQIYLFSPIIFRLCFWSFCGCIKRNGNLANVNPKGKMCAAIQLENKLKVINRPHQLADYIENMLQRRQYVCRASFLRATRVWPCEKYWKPIRCA